MVVLIALKLDAQVNKDLKLFWIECYREDGLPAYVKNFSYLLYGKGISNTFFQTQGGHSFLVGRSHINEFLPLLFK
jgi:hypothetical protein